MVYDKGDGFEMMGFFVIVLLLGIFSRLLYALASYVAESIYLMETLKLSSVRYRAQVWIPIYGQYLYGKLAGMIRMGMVLVLLHTSVAICFLFLCFLDADVLFLEIIMMLSVIGFLLKLIVDHKMYSRITEKRWLFTILSVLSWGWFRTIILLLFRNKFAEVGANNLHKLEENNL
jgi:hypothetical protein